MRYAVISENGPGDYSAYVPDLPGCVATGDTVAGVAAEIRDAIRFHIDGLREDGQPAPEATTVAEYVEAKGPAYHPRMESCHSRFRQLVGLHE